MDISLLISQAIQTIDQHYSPLSDQCKTELRGCFKTIQADKQTLLVREGQYAAKSFFIIQGSVRAYYLKDGKDITDWFAFENDFVSSIHSFFLDKPSPCIIETIEPSILLEISRTDIQRLCDAFPEFDRLCRIIVTKAMLQLQQRISAIQFETAQQKYENLLQLRPDITQRVALGHIASYLGITLETLSRIRNPKNRI